MGLRRRPRAPSVNYCGDATLSDPARAGGIKVKVRRARRPDEDDRLSVRQQRLDRAKSHFASSASALPGLPIGDIQRWPQYSWPLNSSCFYAIRLKLYINTSLTMVLYRHKLASFCAPINF